MGCFYCNEWASKKLYDVMVCEDCFQTVKHMTTDKEVRRQTIIDRLQKIHGLLLKASQSPTISDWVKRIGVRLEYLGASLKTTHKTTGPLKLKKFK